MSSFAPSLNEREQAFKLDHTVGLDFRKAKEKHTFGKTKPSHPSNTVDNSPPTPSRQNP
jgi:hypothetical protein